MLYELGQDEDMRDMPPLEASSVKVEDGRLCESKGV
jgi:hypothetical protein